MNGTQKLATLITNIITLFYGYGWIEISGSMEFLHANYNIDLML